MGSVRQFCAKTLEPFDVSIAREFDTIVQVCTRGAHGGRGKGRWGMRGGKKQEEHE